MPARPHLPDSWLPSPGAHSRHTSSTSGSGSGSGSGGAWSASSPNRRRGGAPPRRGSLPDVLRAGPVKRSIRTAARRVATFLSPFSSPSPSPSPTPTPRQPWDLTPAQPPPVRYEPESPQTDRIEPIFPSLSVILTTPAFLALPGELQSVVLAHLGHWVDAHRRAIHASVRDPDERAKLIDALDVPAELARVLRELEADKQKRQHLYAEPEEYLEPSDHGSPRVGHFARCERDGSSPTPSFTHEPDAVRKRRARMEHGYGAGWDQAMASQRTVKGRRPRPSSSAGEGGMRGWTGGRARSWSVDIPNRGEDWTEFTTSPQGYSQPLGQRESSRSSLATPSGQVRFEGLPWADAGGPRLARSSSVGGLGPTLARRGSSTSSLVAVPQVRFEEPRRRR